MLSPNAETGVLSSSYSLTLERIFEQTPFIMYSITVIKPKHLCFKMLEGRSNDEKKAFPREASVDLGVGTISILVNRGASTRLDTDNAHLLQRLGKALHISGILPT